MSTLSVKPLLAQIPIFSGLGEAETEALAARVTASEYESGQYLFLEGEPARGLYLVGRGSVKIFKTSSSGREVMLALIPAPSSVAEVPLFDGAPYPASAVATEKSVILFLDSKDFQHLCHQFPAIPMQCLRVAGRRLRQLVGTIERISFGSIRQRLAAHLLEYAGDEFTLPVTHQELASRLGTVREVVTRNLGRFQAEGLVEVAGRSIKVLDREGLRREAETEL